MKLENIPALSRPFPPQEGWYCVKIRGGGNQPAYWSAKVGHENGGYWLTAIDGDEVCISGFFGPFKTRDDVKGLEP